MFLLLWLSLRAYEMTGKLYALVVLPTSEPAFVIIAGMKKYVMREKLYIRAWFDHGSEDRVMRFKQVMWMIGCPLSNKTQDERLIPFLPDNMYAVRPGRKRRSIHRRMMRS